MLLIELIIRADLDYYEESSVGLQSSEQGKSIDYVSTNNNTSFITDTFIHIQIQHISYR
jgi:hypothetical protein